MLNVFLFLLFFVLVAFVFDSYCCHELSSISNSKNKILPLTIKSVIFISLIVLIPTLMVAFRSENTGVDTIRYIQILDRSEKILEYRMHSSGEFLFWNLCLFFKEHSDIRSFFFLLAFIPLFFSFATFYKLSPVYNPFISSIVFLLIFYQECFNATRQMPAVAIVFFSYTYVVSRKFIPFLICILLAVSFHATALTALPLYFLYPQRPLNSWDFLKRSFLFICFIIVISLFFKSILSFEMFSHFASYGENIFQVTIGQSLLNFFVSYFPIILVLIIFGLSVKLADVHEVKDFHFLWMATLLFCFIILLRFVDNWFFRVAFYYQLGEILIISKVCSKNYGAQTNVFLTKYSFSIQDIILSVLLVFSYIRFHMFYYNESPFVNFSLSF